MTRSSRRHTSRTGSSSKKLQRGEADLRRRASAWLNDFRLEFSIDSVSVAQKTVNSVAYVTLTELELHGRLYVCRPTTVLELSGAVYGSGLVFDGIPLMNRFIRTVNDLERLEKLVEEQRAKPPRIRK